MIPEGNSPYLNQFPLAFSKLRSRTVSILENKIFMWGPPVELFYDGPLSENILKNKLATIYLKNKNKNNSTGEPHMIILISKMLTVLYLNFENANGN